MAILGGYGAIVGDNPITVPVAPDSKDYIDTAYTLSAGVVNSFTFFGSDIGSVKLKVWRESGSDYTIVGESEAFPSLTNGVNEFTLSSTITVEDGDFIGLWVQGDSGGTLDLDANTGSNVVARVGDNSGTVAVSSFSEVLSDLSLCVTVEGTTGTTGSGGPVFTDAGVYSNLTLTNSGSTLEKLSGASSWTNSSAYGDRVIGAGETVRFNITIDTFTNDFIVGFAREDYINTQQLAYSPGAFSAQVYFVGTSIRQIWSMGANRGALTLPNTVMGDVIGVELEFDTLTFNLYINDTLEETFVLDDGSYGAGFNFSGGARLALATYNVPAKFTAVDTSVVIPDIDYSVTPTLNSDHWFDADLYAFYFNTTSPVNLSTTSTLTDVIKQGTTGVSVVTLDGQPALDFSQNTVDSTNHTEIARYKLSRIGNQTSGTFFADFYIGTDAFQLIFAHPDYDADLRFYVGFYDGKVWIQFGGAATWETTQTFAPGERILIGISWVGFNGIATIYINGIISGTYSYNRAPGGTSVTFDTAIGCSLRDSASLASIPFAGQIRTLLISSSASTNLQLEEITTDYSSFFIFTSPSVPVPDYHWPLDGNVDEVINGVIGLGQNGPMTYTNGYNGQAAEFVGNTDFRIFGTDEISELSALVDQTISFWVKIDDGSTSQMFVANHYFPNGDGDIDNKGLDIGHTAAGNIYAGFLVKDNESYTDSNGSTRDSYHIYAPSPNTAPVGEWIHITAAYTSNSVKLYENGVLVCSASSVANRPSGTSSRGLFAFGCRASVISSVDVFYRPLDGLLDDVKIWARELTSQEIQLEYQSQLPSVPVPDYYWPFDGNADEIVADGGTFSTVGTIGYEATPYGQGAVFDGSLTNRLSKTSRDATFANLIDYTFSIWLKTNSFSDYQGVFSNHWYKEGSGSADNGGEYLYLGTDGKLVAGYVVQNSESYTDSNGVSYSNHAIYAADPDSLALDTWYHITVVFSSNSVKLYRDGNLVCTTVSAGAQGTGVSSNARFSIGSRTYSFDENNPMDGTLDELKIWTRELTSQEIQVEYQNLLPSAPAPDFYWPLDGNGNEIVNNFLNLSPYGVVNYATGYKDQAFHNTTGGNSNLLKYPVRSGTLASLIEQTLSAWFNLELVDGGTQTIVSNHQYSGGSGSGNNGGTSIVIRPDGKLAAVCCVINDESYTDSNGNNANSYYVTAITADVVSLSTWSHAAAVYNTNGVKLYLNGVEVSSVTTVQPIRASINSDGRIVIGATNIGDVGNYAFNGLIDDVKLWTRKLTTQEIQAEYQGRLPSAPDPDFYWPLDSDLLQVLGTNTIGVTNYGIQASYEEGFKDNALRLVSADQSELRTFSRESDLDTDEQTISVWIKPGTFGGNQRIVDNQLYIGSDGNSLNAGTSLMIRSDGKISAQQVMLNNEFHTDSNGTETSTYVATVRSTVEDGVSEGEWAHVVATFSLNTIKIYKNGNLVGEVTTIQPRNTNTSTLKRFCIGMRYRNGSVTEFYDGLIDELKMWTRVLTPQEIEAEYQESTDITLSAAVSIQKSLLWDIDNTQPISVQKVIPWDINNSVTTQENIVWTTSNGVSQQIVIPWEIGVPRVQIQTDIDWTIAGVVSLQTSIPWNISGEASLQHTIDWLVSNNISSQQTQDWLITNYVSSQKTVAWEILEPIRVSSQGIISWTTVNEISSQKSISWITPNLVTTQKISSWLVTNEASTSNTLDWTIINKTNKQTVLSWDYTDIITLLPEITIYVPRKEGLILVPREEILINVLRK